MPRRARLRLAGIPWHIIQRGNNRSACFVDDADRRLYLGLLQEAAFDTDCTVHAFVLMSNHVHLLLTPREMEGPSEAMKQLGERYVRRFNQRHGRSGTLWEGRFRSSLVESDAYLITCQRYIELNPVRAGMVMHPRAFPWSSHRFHAQGEPSTLIRPHVLYDALGDTADKRQAAYRAAFEEPLSAADLKRIRSAVNGGFALGGPQFVREVEHLLARRARAGDDGRPRKSWPQVEDMLW